MTVAFDAKSQGSGNFVSSVSFTHTPVGTPTAVGIGEFGFNPSAGTVTATYDGTAVPSAIGPDTDAIGDTAQIFGLANPASGAKTVVVSCNQLFYPIVYVATVTGSDTATCFSAVNSAIGNSSAPSVTLTGGATGELVFCVGGCDGGGADMSAGGGGSNTTDLYVNDVVGGERASSSTAPGAASVTATYSLSGISPWIIQTASFKDAGGGGVIVRGSTLSMMGVG